MINKSEVAETITLFTNKMGIIFVVEEKNNEIRYIFWWMESKNKNNKKKWKIKFSFVF